ncbi:MAG: EamA family transporter [Elusimicrobia bacterium]|nr:EamA family transporter [Elusimicrobiota bacterium]MBD3412239.1 EamA family transporter [Elusimicrobiota bacterium]
MSAFVYALLTACLWGMVPVIEKIGLGKVPAGVGLFYRGFGVIIGMLCLGFWFTVSETGLKIDLKSASLLMLGGILASFIGQFFFYRALKLGDASLVVPVGATYPLVSFVLAVLVLHEKITPGRIFGILMIIAGIVLIKGK